MNFSGNLINENVIEKNKLKIDDFEEFKKNDKISPKVEEDELLIVKYKELENSYYNLRVLISNWI